MLSTSTPVILLALLVFARARENDGNLRRNGQESSKMSEASKIIDNIKRELNIQVTPVLGGEIGGEELNCDNILNKPKVLRNNQLLGAKNITRIGGVRISEGFQGLTRETPKGILGLEDNLVGEPAAPLKLKRNFNHRENIYITKECSSDSVVKEGVQTKCTLNVMGRGPAGFKGFGAMALYFDEGQSRIQLKFWSDGTAEAAVMFYKEDATHLGTLYVDLNLTTEYIFERTVSDIKGIGIWPRGEQMEWHRFGMIGLCHE